ncbi:hypothetical protein D3C76_1813570 [compost metagenome]
MGFRARKAGVSVGWKPAPQSSRSKGISNSMQAQRTLRTLMEESLPNIRSML